MLAGISTGALMSLMALAAVVVISCVSADLNVGVLSIALAVIVGGVWTGLTGARIMEFWPLGLFMVLVGVTFLFAIAQTNGTMEKLTAHAVRASGGRVVFMPFIVYVLVTLLTAIGPGNIAATALMAPLAMAIATRIHMSAFLMTLLVVGAANGAAFSPFAPTGIISNGIIAKMAPQLPHLLDRWTLESLGWKVYLNSEYCQGIVNIGGFFVTGGWTWIMTQKGRRLDIEAVAPRPEPFTSRQWCTLGAMLLLIVVTVVPALPGMRPCFARAFLNVAANVGSVAFILAAGLMLLGAGDSKEAVKAMPWGVILMVCGVTVLIEVMDKAGGLAALVKMIGGLSGPVTVNFWVGLFAGAISAYSSSSGVVMPMFLPLVPGLIAEVGAGDAIAMISSINVGSHLVDTSPLSTLGALCIACAGAHEDKVRLFRNLLIWGLSMAVVGAMVCYGLFGLLGW